MKNRTVFKKLIPYLYRYRYKFLFMVFLAIIGNVLTLIGPYLVGKAINQIHIDMDRENFIFLGKISLCLLFTYIGGAFLSLTQNIKMNNISQEIVNAMRQNAFKKMHKFPLKMFNTMAQGNIMTIVINDIDNISSSLSQIGTRIIVNLLTISIALAIMIYISPSLTLIQMILVAISGFFLKKITKKSKEKRRVQQKFLGRLNSYVDEILTGQAEVKSFSYEERAINKFRELNGAYKENAIKAIFFSGFNFPTLNFINNIGYSLIIFTGAVFMLQGKINLGELSSFIIYSKLFNRPIASISEAYNIIQTVLVSSERFFGFMDLPEDDEGGDRELDLSKVQGNIEFKDVNFGYNDNSPVLKDLSFKTKEGKTVAIVGPTGGRKDYNS
ncbi:putative ABC transporter ATP-binding protein [Fusobacterium sp. DD28]|uniref:ABC transporter ATP-binding protein n=1 Tax=Fusobacterium sp. DD28 TaxID=2789596 RepID=UPI0020110045|nr:ABC transporter ATP-binding protein [Fusobacterium sp. DD28]MBR8710585.1 putative ABC transporter ATP-binding protein [Fusobacterium sp. DD28]